MLPRPKLALWVSVCAAAIVWLVAAAVLQASQLSTYHRHQAQAQTQAHFYKVLAGEADQGVGVADTLAVDLRRTPDSKLRFFRGNSNSYGSIREQLGFDPFDESCGVECGPLTDSTLTRVRYAKRGDYVVPKVERHVISLAIPIIGLVLWSAIGLFFLFAPNLKKLRWQRQMEHAYPDEWHTIERLTEALNSHRLSAIDMKEIGQLRDNLQSALQLRVSSGASDVITEQRVERLKGEARNKLSAVEAGNRFLEG